MPFTNHTFTYSARIAPDPTLVRIAACCSAVERRLHAHRMHGGILDQALKRQVMQDSGLPGRYYNGITTVLEGKIDAVRALRALEIAAAGERVKQIGKRIEALQQDLAELEALPQPREKKVARKIRSKRRAIHGKKRKLDTTKQRMNRLQDDLDRNVPSLCFGSKRLFRKQFHLTENGYRNHAEWLADWRAARCGQFMLPGSHEEVSGNKTCTAQVEEDGSVTLRLLVPAGLRLAPSEKHLVIPNVRFGYGHAEVVAAIDAANAARPDVLNFQAETKRLVAALSETHADASAGRLAAEAKALRKRRNDAARQARAGHSTALTWRFVHDASGWFVHVTVNRRLEQADWDFAHGAIGLDLNEGFISFMPVDGTGNPLKGLSCEFPVETVSLSSDRTKAVLGDACKRIVELALEQRRPIVIEKLDFGKKKAALKETCGPGRARRLSAFAYNQFKAMLLSRAARMGVRVIAVNPAYTSHMGRAKYARPLGISVHRVAAAMIARRGMGLSEGLSASAALPLGDGRHVTLAPPEPMGRRHVWRSWGRHFGRYKAKREALDAAEKRIANGGRELRSGGARNRRKPQPGPVAMRQERDTPASAAMPGTPGTQPLLLLGGRPATRRGSDLVSFDQVS
jgi:IS605 OrfB family transposase